MSKMCKIEEITNFFELIRELKDAAKNTTGTTNSLVIKFDGMIQKKRTKLLIEVSQWVYIKYVNYPDYSVNNSAETLAELRKIFAVEMPGIFIFDPLQSYSCKNQCSDF